VAAPALPVAAADEAAQVGRYQTTAAVPTDAQASRDGDI